MVFNVSLEVFCFRDKFLLTREYKYDQETKEIVYRIEKKKKSRQRKRINFIIKSAKAEKKKKKKKQ